VIHRRFLCVTLVWLVALWAAGWAGARSALAQAPADDSRDYHLITVTQDPPTPACSALLASLASPDLATIAGRCKVFSFRPRDVIYRERYAAALPPESVPIIALVRYDGGVLYKASGSRIPRPAALAAELNRVAAVDQKSWAQTQQLLPGRPRLIPDSVVIKPQVNVPAMPLAIGVFAVIVFFAFGCCGAAAIFALIFYPRR